jgi:hypothetical protein
MLDLCTEQRLLHRGRVSNRLIGVGLERFDEGSRAAVGQPSAHEGLSIGQTQQPRLDADATAHEVLAQLANAVLALVRRHELREHRPARHELEPPARLGLDARRRTQGDPDPRAQRADRLKRGRARLGCQRLATRSVVWMQVEHPSTGFSRRTSLLGEVLRGPRDSGVLGGRT